MTIANQMKVSMRVRGVDKWNDELREQVERGIAFAVDRYDTHVRRVSIYLMDLNGPKGGNDILCQITAHLRRGKPVSILEKGSEVVATVNRAVGRLRYQIGRSIERRKGAGVQRHSVSQYAA